MITPHKSSKRWVVLIIFGRRLSLGIMSDQVSAIHELQLLYAFSNKMFFGHDNMTLSFFNIFYLLRKRLGLLYILKQVQVK